MPGAKMSPTRINLLRARRQLVRVRKGAELLRRKREALVAELFRLARPAVDARAVIIDQVDHAYPVLVEALAVHGHAGVRALSWPVRQLELEIRPAQIWGVPVADIERASLARRTLDARGVAPGSAGPAAEEAALRFETLLDLLIDAAPRELRIRRLADAVAQTSRQLHALERRVEPGLVAQIAQVRRTLEEREREEHLALKHLQGVKGRER